jgi:phosphoserine phosphatase
VTSPADDAGQDAEAGRFRLVTLDLDGTLLPRDTVFAAILRDHGFAEEVKASDAAYFAGRISLEECFWEQWKLIQSLTLADLHRSLRKAAWLPGIAEGVARLHKAGLRVCLLTDQPSTCTDFLGRWGLTDAICSPVTVKDGRQVAIDGRFDKLANLRHRLAEWGIAESEVCHVGNGVNDIPVFQAVGGAVAVDDDARVRSAAQAWLPEPASLGDVVDAVLALHAGTTDSSVKSPHAA